MLPRVPTQPVTRLLLVDGDPGIRAALRLLLELQPGLVVTGEAEDGESALIAAEQLRPDVVLMDVQMRGIDGIAATARLTTSLAHPPAVLILTTFDLPGRAEAARAAGAAGLLLKRAPVQELVAAIREAAAGAGVD